MPRKTENKRVLARIGDTRVATSAPAKALRDEVKFTKLENASFGTMVNEMLSTALRYAVRHAPGDRNDPENAAFAEYAFYDELGKLVSTRRKRAAEVLVEEGLIVDPNSHNEPGVHELGQSSGFKVNVTVSQPRTVQDDNFIIQKLLKDRKVPAEFTKQVLDESKRPIGAKSRTLRIGQVAQIKANPIPSQPRARVTHTKKGEDKVKSRKGK